MTDTHTGKYWRYMHDSEAACQTFMMKVMAAARKDKDIRTCIEDPRKVSDDTRESANADLFYIMVEMIGDDKLMNTLATSYLGKGHEALNYIRGCWKAGSDKNRLRANQHEYNGLAYGEPPDDTITSTEFRERANRMIMLKTTLDGTERAFPDKKLSMDMIDMTMRIGSTHDLEVRLQESAVVALIDDPGQVASALESIIAKVKSLMSPKTKVTGIAAMVTQM